MKTEQEIVLQKKSIIIIALVIFAVIFGSLDIQKRNSLEIASKEIENICINDESGDETVTVYTSYGANEELFIIEVSGDNIVNEPSKEDIVSNVEVEEPKKDEQIEEKSVVSNVPYIFDTSLPPTEYKEVIPVTATAYCLCKQCCGKNPGDYGYGCTASGYKIVPGTNAKVIAVDTDLVDLGTKVYVEGLNGAKNYGYALAADTGSAIKSDKIDLYMDTHQQALNWGVRKVNLYILGE